MPFISSIVILVSFEEVYQSLSFYYILPPKIIWVINYIAYGMIWVCQQKLCSYISEEKSLVLFGQRCIISRSRSSSVSYRCRFWRLFCEIILCQMARVCMQMVNTVRQLQDQIWGERVVIFVRLPLQPLWLRYADHYILEIKLKFI